VPGSAVTAEQQAYFQGIVNGMQVHFDEAVRKGRGLSKAQLDQVRTGGVWKADEAQALGLIDGIQPLQKTLDMLAGAADQRGTRQLGILPMLRGRRLPTREDDDDV
jgi:ClpP class serine protease